MSEPKVYRRGRPPCCPRELAIRILSLRRQGLSYMQICEVLNAEGVPTPMGRSRWSKSTIDRVLHTQYVRDLTNVEEPGAS